MTRPSHLFSWSLGLALISQALFAGTINVQKDVTFRIAPTTALGTAVLGVNEANDYSNGSNTSDKKGPANHAFSVSITGDSLATKTLTAKELGAEATSTAKVGKAVAVPGDAAGRLDIPATLTAKVTVPEHISFVPSLRGGKSSARAKVNLKGTMTINQLKVDNTVIRNAAKIEKALIGLKRKGIFLDPVNFSATNLNTGQAVDADVFRADYRAEDGAAVGFNTLDRLELDVFGVDGIAEVIMQTLVPWASGPTGSATLANGLFSATGVFFPGSGVITDYWDLIESSPGYVVNAMLKSGVVDFDITVTPGALLSGADSDLVDYQYGVDVFAQLETVPLPGTLALIGVAWLLRVGRHGPGRRRMR